jgi:transcriptional regulator with XRE-family HTH domain
MLNKETLTIYKPLNLQKPAIPQRSELYSLEPIGVGTPYIESLTSYITRLAEAHCVPTGRLISAVIISRYQEEDLSNSKQKNTYNLIGSPQHHRALNGIGIIANRLIDTLESLTLRSDLRFLTMVTWSEVISDRSLFRPSRAWCPICYEEWRETEKLIYEPLIWGLELVKVCPIHYQFLQTLCPHCGKKLLSLEWHSRPGYCSKCGQWLGYSSNTKFSDKNNVGEQELDWLLWAANNVGDLLAASSDLKLVPLKNTIAASLRNYADYFAQGNIAEFARYLELPRNSLWLWCQGTNQPSLNTLVRICYYLQVSLLNFLTQQELFSEQPQKTTLFPTKLLLKPRATIKPFEFNRVKYYLENILLSNEFPPPSMEEVARRLGCDRRTIYNHFQDLCNSISDKYVSYRKARYLESVAQSCKEAREAALKLHQNGEYPSEARVLKLISKPGFFRYKEVRAALSETRRELGLDS